MKPGMKGGVDIEAALSQEGWAVRAVEEGTTWEKLARAMVGGVGVGEVGEAEHEGWGGYRGSFVTGGLGCEGSGGGEDMGETGKGDS